MGDEGKTMKYYTVYDLDGAYLGVTLTGMFLCQNGRAYCDEVEEAEEMYIVNGNTIKRFGRDTIELEEIKEKEFDMITGMDHYTPVP